jgi:pimeloyl-ACP methyl ester carboxylesterase
MVLAYLAVCGYLALSLTQPVRRLIDPFPASLGVHAETIAFPSRIDAIPLDGWLVSPAESAPASRPVVMVHGRGSDREHEVGGRAPEIAARLAHEGHPTLLFDLRGSGRSGGKRFTLGAQEVRDVGAAVDFLARRGLAPQGVDLLGFSMGAATSMLTAAHEPRVRAVVEDSGYADLGDVLNDQVPKASGLPRWFTPGVVFMAWPLMGVNAYAIRPIDGLPALAARGVPLLVIHGEGDTLVPVGHGRRLAAAYGPGVETYFVPGAAHVGSFKVDPETYLARLTAFLAGAEAPR